MEGYMEKKAVEKRLQDLDSVKALTLEERVAAIEALALSLRDQVTRSSGDSVDSEPAIGATSETAVSRATQQVVAKILRTQNYGDDVSMTMFIAEVAMELDPRPWLIDSSVPEGNATLTERFREERREYIQAAGDIVAMYDLPLDTFTSVYQVLKYCGIDVPPFMVQTVIDKLKDKPATFQAVKRIMKKQDWTMDGVDTTYRKMETDLLMSYGWKAIEQLGQSTTYGELDKRIHHLMDKYMKYGYTKRPVIQVGYTLDEITPTTDALLVKLAEWIDAKLLYKVNAENHDDGVFNGREFNEMLGRTNA
jgi:hypothetical protein